jgi:endonuclease YncB( thermonuclease family)
MSSGWIALAVALTVLAPGAAQGKRKQPKTPKQFLYLDGVKEQVNWNDGDSFRVLNGPRKGVKARMSGYNTLESYGPVHFWGSYHAYQLYDLGKDGMKLARSAPWNCKSLGPKDGYGRIIVACADLTKAILAKGYAHVFAVGSDPDPDYIAIQLKAQNDREGIWKWGIPARIVTSIHSTLERPDKPESYNRVCDTRTGRSWVVKHRTAFKPCDAWCDGGSCMVYVPFEVRFGDKRPACMRQGRDNRLTTPPHLGYPLKDSW